LRTVWLTAEVEDEPGEVIVVDAVLHVIHHKEKIAATGRFEGFTEYRLVTAARSKAVPRANY
jgi:hypothetical protein